MLRCSTVPVLTFRLCRIHILKIDFYFNHQRKYIFGRAPDFISFQSLVNHGDRLPEVRIDPVTDTCALPFSSGTTGLPKGVMLTHHNIVANICQIKYVEYFCLKKNQVNIINRMPLNQLKKYFCMH